MNTTTLTLVTAGSFDVTWFVSAKFLFRKWRRSDTFRNYHNYEIAVMAMVTALVWPVALVIAGVMHNAPKSRAVLDEEIAALELENNRLRHEEWKRGGDIEEGTGTWIRQHRYLE